MPWAGRLTAAREATTTARAALPDQDMRVSLPWKLEKWQGNRCPATRVLARRRGEPRRGAAQGREVAQVHRASLQIRQTGARQAAQLPVGRLAAQVRERGDQI